MDWKKELEALVKESTVLVDSAGGAVPIEKPRAPSAPTATAQGQASPPGAQHQSWYTSEREQIGKIVATFKAHQERVRRERENYFCRTISELAILREGSAPTNRVRDDGDAMSEKRFRPCVEISEYR